MMVPDDKVCFEESCASSWRFQWQQTSRNGIGKDYHGWGVECPAVATTKNDFWLNIMLDMLALYQRWCMLARTNMYVYIYIYIHIILIHLVYVSTCVPFSTCTCYPPGCSRSGGSVSSQSGLRSGPSQGGSQDSLPRAMCHGGHGSFVGQVEWSTSPSSRDGNNPHMPQIYIYIFIYIYMLI